MFSSEYLAIIVCKCLSVYFLTRRLFTSIIIIISVCKYLFSLKWKWKKSIFLSLQKFFLFYYSTKISLDSFLSNFIRSNHLEFLSLSNSFPEKLILFIYLKVAQKYPFDFNIIYSCDPFQIIILPIKHEEFERKRLNRD